MENFIQRFNQLGEKKKFTLLVIVSLLGFFSFVFIAFSLLNRPITSTDSGEDPFGPGEEYTKGQNEIEAEFFDEDQASSRVTNLISKLPYTGTNFELSYDYENLSFVLTLNSQNQTAGLTEFGQFLITNGVRKDLIERNLVQQTDSLTSTTPPPNTTPKDF
jgi:hypothetical protein